MSPRATYRLQFHSGFTFADAVPLASYLAHLGISHVYASPIAKARAGSTHGYDVVDPTVVNPELGGELGFRALAAALRAEGLGIILDIVPNHVAVGGSDNAWWLDVLENGEASRHAAFFDIDWRPADPALRGKVLAPFLGVPYGAALEAGDIRLKQSAAGKIAAVAHDHHCFPIRPQDYDEVLGCGLASFDPASEAGRAKLHRLLEQQNYRLAWWQVAGDEINWRRFFDITELAAVRVDQPDVFETVHALPLRLYEEGLIDGLRADHVDGLADPGAYCRAVRAELERRQPRRPQEATPGPAYFIVEDILAPHERLPQDWRCDGTTGYDFMNDVAALLHHPDGAEPLTRHWVGLSGRSADFETEERTARREILARSFAGQLEDVAAGFHRIARADISTRDLTRAALRRALTTLLSVFPAYRTYAAGAAAEGWDRTILSDALARALQVAGPGEAAALQQVVAWLAGEAPNASPDLHRTVRRFQQLSAPVSAKSVEDTAFYRYGRLLSRNDVGFDPGRLASSVEHFHRACAERAAAFPSALLATATHDHKRGEDVRARLAVLSEVPDPWIKHSIRWRSLAAPEAAGVDLADAYQLHQMLVGAFPLDLNVEDRPALEDFGNRVGRWLEKFLREAKLRSSWTAPNQAYEAQCRDFLARVLEPGAPALNELTAFVERIASAGALNSLTQTFLRCVTPGIPDTFQGTEFWDFSLVDPDNRRPVDFASRKATINSDAPDVAIKAWRTGAVKQAIIAGALRVRRQRPRLFHKGNYRALEVRGRRSQSVIAFLRQDRNDVTLAAAALHCGSAMLDRAKPTPEPDWWDDTAIVAPPGLSPERLYDRLTDRSGPELSLSARSLFTDLPVALLATWS